MRALPVFLAGTVFGGVVVWFVMATSPSITPAHRVEATTGAASPAASASMESTLASPVSASPPIASAGTPSEPATPTPEASVAPVATTTAPAALLIPVDGVRASQLSDTFDQARAAGRRHDAIDIMAPRGTRVLAAADGNVVKLFTSVRGGLTVYEFDPNSTVEYYYAHLDSYAPGLAEGATLHRGDPIGFVGSSGDADPAAPHLHFEIALLGPEKHWWQATDINPYPVLTGRQTLEKALAGAGAAASGTGP